MLCPKCGFISFDNLPACGKCHGDLSGVAAELHGTATEGAGRFFLGALIKDDVGTEVPAGRFDDSPAIASALAQDDEGAGAEGSALTFADEDLGEEEASLFSVDESPALELGLDETPRLDKPDSGLAVGAGTPGGERPESESDAESVPLDLDAEEGSAPSSLVDDQAESGPPALEIDASSLTLDSDSGAERSDVLPEPPTEGGQDGALTIDLNSIDLSDLVHGGTGPADQREGADRAEGEGVDLDDTMDLSLFAGEGQQALSVEADQSSNEDDLNPIDLTLMDDALEELAVEPGRKGQAPYKKESGILGLSMEEGTKE